MNKAVRLFGRFCAAVWVRIGHVFSDSVYLKVRHRLLTGKSLNLQNPVTFTEKMQWLKLYDRQPEYTNMVDKLAVKDYVANIIGKQYIIPTLGVWNDPKEIEWNKLPEQFVLKTTHGGGSLGVVVCKNKNTLDRKMAVDKLKKSLKTDAYRIQTEWPYKNVPRLVFAEQFIAPHTPSNESQGLQDYKFFCFNGEPHYCQVIGGRDTKMCIDFFDKDWNHQPFHEPRNYPFADIEPEKPKHLDKMWNLARQLAGNRAFSRIDFYEVDDNIYFGEITFFPTSGIGGFKPQEYDRVFGDLINLDNVKKNQKV